MKHVIFTIFFLLSTLAFTQSVLTKWSKLKFDGAEFSNAVGLDKSGYYFSHKNTVGTDSYQSLTTCGIDLSKPNTVNFPLNFIETNRTGNIIDFIADNGELFVLARKDEHKVGASFMLNQLIIKDNGGYGSLPGKEIYRFDWKSITNIGHFTVVKSKNTLYTLVFAEHPIEKKSPTSTVGITVLKGAEVLSSATFNLDLTARKLNQFTPTIDDQGNVLIKVKYKKDKKWTNACWFYGFKAPAPVKLDFEVPGYKPMWEVTSVPVSPTEVTITGAFHDPMVTEGAVPYADVAVFSIDVKDNVMGIVKKNYVEEAFYKKFYQTDNLENLQSVFNQMKLVDAYLLSNGDKVMLLERQSDKRVNITPKSANGAAGPAVYTYDLVYREIVMFCLEKGTANVKWNKVIRKYQKARDKNGYSDRVSFVSTCVNDVIYILYNEIGLGKKRAWTEENGEAVNRMVDDKQVYPVMMHLFNKDGKALYSQVKYGQYQPEFFSATPKPMFLKSKPVIRKDDGSLVVIGCGSVKNAYVIGEINFQ